MNKAILWFPVVAFAIVMITHIVEEEYYSAWLAFTTTWFAFVVVTKAALADDN